MAEVRFYHLLGRTLEGVLPVMLERTLARGGRAVIRGTEPARLEALNRHLWTYDEASFLPHGLAGAATNAAEQPVWLTADDDLPNDPNTLFLIDGAMADPAVLGAFETTALLFDGNDANATETARDAWRQVTGAGLKAVYWAEDPERGWVKRAESS
ncbi:MAG: DNA polymerase III subunit chi [Pseudomonadota bacterium]